MRRDCLQQLHPLDCQLEADLEKGYPPIHTRRPGQMPLNSLQPRNKRKFTLLTAAFLLLAFAGVAMAMGGSTVMAMVAVSTSLVCIRLINVRTPSGSATEASQREESSWATPLRRPIGIISIILVPIMAMASFFLYRDAVQGYHQSWPLDFFAATAAICALCWSYLFSTLLGP